MVTSSSANSQRDWALIRRSNPFANLLGPLHKCKLNDHSFRFLLSLERKRNNQAPSTEIIGGGEAFQLAWSDLEVLALVGPPARAELGPSPRVSLIFVTHGKVCLFQGSRHLCTAAAGSCLIIPGTPIRWVSTACSVVCVMLSWQNLGEMAASINSNGSEVVQYPLMLENPISCKPSDGQLDAQLLSLLDCTLRTISALQESNPSLIRPLGLVEQIYRQVAILAFPNLRQVQGVGAIQPSDGQLQDSFDQLIDYITANLDKTLSLTSLAELSNYSTRALQYAFRQRMGCTATQWIRAKRLDLARQRLLKNSTKETVTSIASACGYRSMGLFSVEFQQRFHIQPSQLLRLARSGHSASAELI